MNVAIMLPNLRGGGAERLATYLALDWQAKGYDVEFVLMRKEGELLTMLSEYTDVIDLSADRIRSMILPLRHYLKSKRPDVIWVGMWPLTSAAIIAWMLAGRPGRLFVTDHNHLSISSIEELEISPLYLKALMRATYPFATGVTAVSEGVKADLCKLGGFSPERVRVINNAAATGVSSERASAATQAHLWGEGFDCHILTVGTLKGVKNQQLLISAFTRLPDSFNAKLTILGEGALRSALETLVAKLGLQHRISFPGFMLETGPWYRSADLFVLSSDWEGFGNVIVEALECGVPVVSTDCPSGPAEILDNGRYGRLVPVGDVDALAQAMAASLQELHDRAGLINRAKDFSVERISEQYLDYFGLPHRV